MVPFRDRAALVIAIAVIACTACGQWQRVGSERGPDPNVLVPRLFDVTSLYRELGLFAAPDPFPYVAAVRYLPGPTADSTLAVLGVSLANKTLSFRRVGDVFEARYRVEAVFRHGRSLVRQVTADEVVRVATFRETQRADESVIFQQLFTLPPESLGVSITVRDRFGSGFSRVEGAAAVPRYGTALVLLPVFEAEPRDDRSRLPELVMSPRATAAYGTDTLRLYLEALALDPSAPIVLRARAGAGGDEVWRDSIALPAGAPLAATVIAVPPGALPVGELELEAVSPTGHTAVARALVGFSHSWVVSNLEETLLLLRYFGADDAMRRLRAAGPEERAEEWKAFWDATDPNPQTPEHEALDAYFRRLQDANERFEEAGAAGWLTDRGEVYITLGEPDEVFDASSGLQGRGSSVIRWTYIGERLTLDFVDETGFGRFRLTPGSRAEYLRVLNRVRRNA